MYRSVVAVLTLVSVLMRTEWRRNAWKTSQQKKQKMAKVINSETLKSITVCGDVEQ